MSILPYPKISQAGPAIQKQAAFACKEAVLLDLALLVLYPHTD